jgi:putative NADH-flavin reductase
MRLTVFGATGRIGQLVVQQALDAGDEVVAVVRSQYEMSHPSLEVVHVSGLTDPAALVPALKGSDAAISGVGARSRKDVTVASSTTRVILRALQDAGVRRFVAVTAAPVGPTPPGESFVTRAIAMPLLRRLLRPIYDDMATMEADIRASGLDWTVVRPPRLLDKPLTGRYRRAIGANVPRGNTIGRADVAHAMLAVLADSATIGQPVGVAS